MSNNYEVTKYRTADLFLNYDQDKMIEKFNLEHDENYLYIMFFSRRYRINRMTGLCEWRVPETESEEWAEAGFEAAMTLYDLLGYSKEGCHLAGTFSSVTRVHGMERVSSQPGGSSMFARTEKILDAHPEELERAVLKLGGVKAGKGDVACRIPMFTFMDVMFEFWFSDEEFPPQMNILFDRNILQYMHYETVYYAMIQLQNQILEMVEDKQTEGTQLK